MNILGVCFCNFNHLQLFQSQNFLMTNVDCQNGGKGVNFFLLSFSDMYCVDAYGEVIHLQTRVNCEEHAEFSPATMRVACKLNQRNVKSRCCKTCQQVESVGKC